MSQEVDGSRIPELAAIARRALELAREAGASQAEADVSLQKGLTATVRLGEVDTVEYQRDRGLGVTVYFGQRKGSASTADLREAAVRDTVAKACAIARHTAVDECSGLADPEDLARDIPDLELDHPWGPRAGTRDRDRARRRGRGPGRRSTHHQFRRQHDLESSRGACVRELARFPRGVPEHQSFALGGAARRGRRGHAARLLVHLVARSGGARSPGGGRPPGG